MKIAISSGHGLYIRGASGPEPWGLDEVDESRRVVPAVCDFLRTWGHEVMEFHDNSSTTQDQNLKNVTNWHNKQNRELDVSVHFNAYVPTSGARGTECLYVSQYELANCVAIAVSQAGGLINRGPKKRTDLYFLNKTDAPAILIETCFVDAAADVQAYDEHFDRICSAIAAAITAEEDDYAPPPFNLVGKVSWFGGPSDQGVSPDEGLAFLYDVDQAPELFLAYQPTGTTGLARRLDPSTSYIATRWDYDRFSKEDLASGELMFLVRAPKTGKEYKARPADWGPHSDTARVADISPGLMEALGIETDDEVEITQVVAG